MKRNLRKILFLILCLFTLLSLTACIRPSEERVRKKMEQELYKDYGEEFVVDRIGLRSANGVKFYQARIYPKSIIGTEKEDDSYYYSTASVDVSRLNKPNSVGNSYGLIKMNDEVEEYLLPKARELFGERIRLKADVEYRIKDGDFFTQYLVAGFEEKRKEVLKNPDTQRLELTLYLYLFDRIDNEREKEERRKQLFEFLQYLRGEGLDRYLKIFMVFADDIILAPSFEEKKYEIESDLGKKNEIEKSLRDEVKNTDINTIYKNINSIKKSNFQLNEDSDIYKYCISRFLILTMEMLKIDEYGRYDEAKKNNSIERHNYKTEKDIEYKVYENYIFWDGE